MILPKYRAQVDLLLQALPHVAKEEIFALKGGSAINLFVRNLPRLSVDIDLTYLPFDDRKTALSNISDALGRIKKRLEASIKGINVIPTPLNQGEDVKLNCQLKNAQIKIEVNTTTRGNIFPVRLLQVNENVQDEFGKFAAINVVSHAELFGGKICAALDRQHPRDLFDVHLLLKNEGYTEDVKKGFMVALLSHMRSMSELIQPHLLDQKSAFEKQFAGMSLIPFTYEDYETTRTQLIYTINSSWTEGDKNFLLSFKRGSPDWELFPTPVLKDMPAIKWKLENINKLIRENPKKHEELVTQLNETLNPENL
jgi:predicted nucleotidyltransferase component of viral defense system